MTPEDLINKYIGTPFKHKGRTVTEGLDCWGLLKLAYLDLGVNLWDIEADYSKDWRFEGKDYFIDNYKTQWNKVENFKLFDGVLMKNRKGIVCHAGIIVGDNSILHCQFKVGVIVSKISDLAETIEGFYRVKELNDTH